MVNNQPSNNDCPLSYRELSIKSFSEFNNRARVGRYVKIFGSSRPYGTRPKYASHRYLYRFPEEANPELEKLRKKLIESSHTRRNTGLFIIGVIFILFLLAGGSIVFSPTFFTLEQPTGPVQTYLQANTTQLHSYENYSYAYTMGKQSSIVFENVNTSSPNSIALIVMSQQQYTNWNQNLTGSATNDFPTYCSTTYFTCLYGLYISSSGITNVKILIPYTSVWYIVFWNSVKSTSVYSVSYTITINIQQTKQVIDLYGLISGNIIVVVIIAGCIIISKKVYKYLIQIIQIYDS